ncbi:hypothetical protein JK211_14410 [Tatumella sp. JGM130]|uniref:hypothetical protein n=1 Tax=Tatumella sp. JGM130 TaxID=2799797 RepID=UPI001BAEF59B|nr:hypothetical protein [Tatumella sp. JGM130]MBS0895207.1 hypothetical protein [Tatumella sp. JGM130]
MYNVLNVDESILSNFLTDIYYNYISGTLDDLSEFFQDVEDGCNIDLAFNFEQDNVYLMLSEILDGNIENVKKVENIDTNLGNKVKLKNGDNTIDYYVFCPAITEEYLLNAEKNAIANFFKNTFDITTHDDEEEIEYVISVCEDIGVDIKSIIANKEKEVLTKNENMSNDFKRKIKRM